MKKMLLASALAVAVAGAAAAADIPLNNWTVAKTGASAGGIHTLADFTQPLPFIGLAPCRIVDTRGNGAPITGGIYAGGEARTYTLTGQCGIPAYAKAVSLNITVTSTQGPGFILTYPAGGTQPTVSTLNYTTGWTIANAAVVPLGSTGASGAAGITVIAGVSGTHVIIDTNGYYSDQNTPGSNGFHILANTSDYAGYFVNSATACNGVCGVLASAASNNNGAIALYGNETSAVGYNVGVSGNAAGIGGTWSTSLPVVMPNGYSTGVYGNASNTSGYNAGVWGNTATTSANGWAAGVLGSASSYSANAGLFVNTGAGANGIYTYVGSTTFGINTNGNIFTSGAITGTTLAISGSKAFIAPHPTDPSKEIEYIAIEGPTADVFFRGTAHLVNGTALIQVPDHFRLTAREDSYMTTVTAVGGRASLWVESEGPDGIVVRGGSDSATFHYVVYGERDEMRDHVAVRDNAHFTPEYLLGKAGFLQGLSARTRDLLVRNGTLNPDMSVNTHTASRLGWTVPVADR